MKNKKGLFTIMIGLMLMASALFLTGYNLYEEHRASQSVTRAVHQLEEFLAFASGQEASAEGPGEGVSAESVGEGVSAAEGGENGTDLQLNEADTSAQKEKEIPDYILNPQMDMPVMQVEGRDYIGILEIPTYELELPVISTWSYSALKEAPCRYSGSAYTNDMVVAGHNYRSHFTCLSDLEVGEQVVFTDMDSNVFVYEILNREILHETDVEGMQEGDWDLTLFTCTADGVYRVTVRCRLV